MNKTLIKVLSGYMAVSDKYKTKSSLATALGLSRPAFHDRWTGKVEWKLSEVSLLCKVLRIPAEDIARII